MNAATQQEPAKIPGLTETDIAYVRRAIDLACQGVEQGNRPFAAILVAADDEVLVEGTNIAVPSGDPLNHAEINVLRVGHLRHGVERMRGATLYVNGEPCTMCAGAILRYGIARLIFGTREPDLLPYLSTKSPVVSYPSAPIYAMAGYGLEVISGVLDEYSRKPFELYVQKGRF